MIPDLRSRLKAVADRQSSAPAPEEAVCRVIESRRPAPEGLLCVTGEQAGWLGFTGQCFDVRRALFLDTETTGLRGAGTVAFLVGLGWLEGDDFVIRQLMIRDYPEEPHQLGLVAEALARHDAVISFNGKSFDMPLLRDRFLMARLRDGYRELPQLDLLHAARRTWKMRLGSCQLSRLEENVLGIARDGDLPGAEVPERFFRYLKTRDETLLIDVLRHNEQDIRTLGVLLARLAAAYQAPEMQQEALDIFSIGRALDRAGAGDRARRCYQVVSVPALAARARRLTAESFARERNYHQAAEAYRAMIALGEADLSVYRALAILLERRFRDVEAAMAVTEQALVRFSGGICDGRAVDRDALGAMERRRVRLRRLLTRSRLAKP